MIEFLSTEQLGSVQMRRELLAHVPRAWTDGVSTRVDSEVTAMLAEQLRCHAEVRDPGELNTESSPRMVISWSSGPPAPIDQKAWLDRLLPRYLREPIRQGEHHHRRWNQSV